MNKIKKIIKEKGIKQSHIAKHLGVSKQSVSLWANNKVNPSMKNLKRLSKLLQVRIDKFF